LNADLTIALLVLVTEFAAKGGENVLHAEALVRPLVDGRVFEIEHHAGGAGIQHFDDEFGFVGGACHLVALIRGPRGQSDFPIGCGGFGIGEEVWQLSAVCGRDGLLAFGDEFLLPKGEALVQRAEEIDEASGKF